MSLEMEEYVRDQIEWLEQVTSAAEILELDGVQINTDAMEDRKWLKVAYQRVLEDFLDEKNYRIDVEENME